MDNEANRSDDVIADTYDKANLDTLTAGIVAAYVGNNHISITELPDLIKTVRVSLTNTGSAAPGEPQIDKPTPAQIKKSVTTDHIVSFEDGKNYKTLKRHLRNCGLTPEAYRAKWGLPADYPMTAPSYSAQRSELARALGLGQQRRAAAPAEAPAEKAKPKPKREKVAKEPEAA